MQQQSIQKKSSCLDKSGSSHSPIWKSVKTQRRWNFHHHEKCLQYLLDGANHPANQMFSSENPRSSWEQPIVGSEPVASCGPCRLSPFFLCSAAVVPWSVDFSDCGHLGPSSPHQSLQQEVFDSRMDEKKIITHCHTSFNLHLSEGFFPPMEGSTAISFTSKSNFTG